MTYHSDIKFEILKLIGSCAEKVAKGLVADLLPLEQGLHIVPRKGNGGMPIHNHRQIGKPVL